MKLAGGFTPYTTKRKRLWDPRIIVEIKRLRQVHFNYGKEKLFKELKPYCDSLGLKCPKQKTIGRLIKDLGGLRTFPQKVRHNGKIVPVKKTPVIRKPKDFLALYPGHCVAMDTIELRWLGTRYYLITLIDLHSRIAFAWATKSHASLAATELESNL